MFKLVASGYIGIFSISLFFSGVCNLATMHMYYIRQGTLLQATETDSGFLQFGGRVGRLETQGKLDFAANRILSASEGHQYLCFLLRLSIHYKRPINIMEGNRLYTKSADLNVSLT